MGRRSFVLLPRLEKLLKNFGEDIRLARLRRQLSAQTVAERVGISRPTLGAVEAGSPSVGLGVYLQVLMVFGLEQNLAKAAQDDELGRRLQDAHIQIRKRAPKRSVKS